MSYELTLHIHENSPQGQNVEALAQMEHVTREESARQLRATPHVITPARERPSSGLERQRAVALVTGSLTGSEWILDDFNDEKRESIEQDDTRDLI